MKKSTKTIELKLERTIPASPSEVYDAWLNSKIPGNPWNIADKLTLNPKVDGFYYLLAHGFSHYGDLPIYQDRATEPNPAYLGIATHHGRRVYGYCVLQETRRKNLDDSHAFRSSQY